MYFDLGFPFFVSDNKLLESCIARDLCHPASRSLLEHTDKLVQPHGGRRSVKKRTCRSRSRLAAPFVERLNRFFILLSERIEFHRRTF